MTQEFLPKSEQKMAYTDPKFTFKLQVVRAYNFPILGCTLEGVCKKVMS